MPILSPQYQKMIDFAKSKNGQFYLIIPPMLNIDLQPCQSSVILVTFFQNLFYRPENSVYSSGYRYIQYYPETKMGGVTKN